MPRTTLRTIETTVSGKKSSLVMVADLSIETRNYKAFYGINGLMKKGATKKIIIAGNESNFMRRLGYGVGEIIDNENIFDFKLVQDPIFVAGKDLELMSGDHNTNQDEWPIAEVDYTCRNQDSKELHTESSNGKTGKLIITGNIMVIIGSATRYFNMCKTPGSRYYMDTPPLINIELDCCNLCFKKTIPLIRDIIVSQVNNLKDYQEMSEFDPHDPEHIMRVTSSMMRGFSNTEAK